MVSTTLIDPSQIVSNTPIITVANSAKVHPNLPFVLIQNGSANLGQNIQFISMPVKNPLSITFLEFWDGGSFNQPQDIGGSSFRERGWRHGDGFNKHQGENDAYNMDVAPLTFSKIR